MNKETLKALRGSIKKWKDIVAGTGTDEGTNNCPLCELFFSDTCAGCPVAKKAHAAGCGKTPYTRWARLLGFAQVGKTAKTPEQISAAKAELKFLQSLLPKKRRRA